MGKGEYLGEFEHLVLLALAAAGDQAHGRSIYEVILAATSRDVAITAVHVTLRRLEKKGLVRSAFAETADPDDARPRKMYEIEPAGEKLLRETRSNLDRLWHAAALRGES